MKKLYFKSLTSLVVCVILSPVIVTAQLNWVSQQSPTDQILKAVFFLDNQTGWAASESSGVIIKTTNGGDEWTQLVQKPNVTFYDLFFINENKGWAVGSECSNNGCEGIIISTNDGGASWTEQVTANDVYMLSVKFVNEQTGWATSGPTGRIYYTTDGGTSWSKTETGSETDFYDTHFFDENTGISVGYLGICMRTNDGGESWTQQSIDLARNFGGVDFVNENRGWAAGSDIWQGLGIIASTMDGGVNWSVQKTFEEEVYFNDIAFLDENTGWAIGYNETGNNIYVTVDGGNTWNLQTHDASTSNLSKIEVIDSEHAWIVGDDGIILSINPEATLPTNVTSPVVAKLSQGVYPNPVNSIASLSFTLKRESQVEIQIVAVTGEVLKIVEKEVYPAGTHQRSFELSDMAEGLYLCTIKTENHLETHKIIIKK